MNPTVYSEWYRGGVRDSRQLDRLVAIWRQVRKVF